MQKKLRLLHWFSQHAFVGHRTLIHRANDQLSARRIILPAEIMEKYDIVPFASTELMISHYSHEILVSSYGADYMTPKKDGANHTDAHDLARMYYLSEMDDSI